MRPFISCKRHDIVKIPSIMLAEYDDELERSEDLRMAVKRNIERENQIQRDKFMKMKAKYDREGVEFISDELELAERQASAAREGQATAAEIERRKMERAHTHRGTRKPGETDSGSDLYNKPSAPIKGLNMGGADQDNQKNPLSMIINAAKKNIGGGN